MVILDTNIIIDYLRRKDRGSSHFYVLAEKYGKESLALSTITVQELFEGKSTRRGEEEKLILSIISSLNSFPYSYDVAMLAGKLARDLDRDIEFADAAIAATAVVNGAQLATLNRKHFQNIKGLELL